jgi:hypothetical protein
MIWIQGVYNMINGVQQTWPHLTSTHRIAIPERVSLISAKVNIDPGEIMFPYTKRYLWQKT